MLVGRVGLAQLVVLLARLVAATSIAFSQLLSAPALVAHAATPTAQCAGAAFQFPVNGVVGWRWHDPRSQWYDPNTGTFADTANGTIDGTPIIHAGIDIFPRGSNAVYPLASGEVVRVGGESFNIWYPDQDIYSYFTHVVHHLKLGDKVDPNTSIGTVDSDYGHIHFSLGGAGKPARDANDKPRGDVPFSDLNPDATRDPSELFKADLTDHTQNAWRGKFGESVIAKDKDGASHNVKVAPAGAPKNVAWTDRPSDLCLNSVTMLVVDVSGSMNESVAGVTKLAAVQRAASNLLDFLRRDTDLTKAAHSTGLITFSDDAKLVSALNGDFTGLRGALGGLRADGNTNLGAGLTSAESQLQGAAGQHRMLVVLTDGVTNQGATKDQIVAGPAARLATAGVCLQAVGFGASGVAYDEPFLRRLAGTSPCGGFYSAANASQLEDVYVSLSHQSAGNTLIAQLQGTIGAGEHKVLDPIEVPVQQAVLHATLNWPGSRLGFELRDPDGRVVSAEYPNATLSVDERPAHVLIANPKPGIWRASVDGIEVSLPREPYTAIFSSRPSPIPPEPAPDPVFPLVVFGLTLVLAATCVVVVVNASRRSPAPVPVRVPAPSPVRSAPIGAASVGSLRIRGQTIPIPRTGLTIGRDPTCDIRIPHDAKVSRRHAVLSVDENAVSIVDLKSANGVQVNGKRTARAMLHAGDVIRVGDTEVVFDSIR